MPVESCSEVMVPLNERILLMLDEHGFSGRIVQASCNKLCSKSCFLAQLQSWHLFLQCCVGSQLLIF